MVEVGQVVMKLAGRDSGEIGVVVDKIDDTHVLIDGNVRRKKCNIKHLELLNKKVDIKKGAPSEIIREKLEKIGIKVKKRGEKRESKPRPRKQRKTRKSEQKEIKKETSSKKEKGVNKEQVKEEK